MITNPRQSPCIVFSHGKESGPSGGKIRHLAEIGRRMGAEVISPDYRDLIDVNERVERLQKLNLPLHSCPVFVGSSMGGYVSVVASRSRKPNGIFLIAPAFGLAGYDEAHPPPYDCDIEIVMGWQDEVISADQVFEWASKYRARLHLIQGDHRLNDEHVLEEIGEHFRRFLKRVFNEKLDFPRVNEFTDT